MKETVLVIDFGSRHKQLIARKVRECNVYSEVIPYKTSTERILEVKPAGIIFAGEPTEACGEKALPYIEEIADLERPILCVCHDLEGHADEFYKGVLSPDDLETLDGVKKLEKFLFDSCKCSGSWNMSTFVSNSIKELKEKIGDKKVLCAFSGGVDSAVAAVMVHKAVGKQLTCIFVDHGLLRKNEAEEVIDVFAKEFEMNIIKVNAEDRFLERLAGIKDPEKKRKIIGEEFIRVFEEEAKKIGKVDFLIQGTIYPDIIESGTADNVAVKSHHNVGGLPDFVDFKEIIEPLRNLFKDEVRKAGLEMSIPDYLVWRQPFPGPGLAVRVIGDITKEKLDILKEADAIFREEIMNAGLNKSINQYFAVLTSMKSVGVSEDKRTYDYTIALRAVETVDFMTAKWSKIPYEILEKTSDRIVKEVKGVNRIVYDITGKPPATIEWE